MGTDILTKVSRLRESADDIKRLIKLSEEVLSEPEISKLIDEGIMIIRDLSDIIKEASGKLEILKKVRR